MKRIGYYFGLAALLFVTPAMAQDVDIDTFETYADITELGAKWDDVAGYPTYALITSGGADETDKYLKVMDAGYSMTFQGTDLVSPPAAGNYIIKLFYQNGIEGGLPMLSLSIDVIQDGAVRTTINLGSDVVSEWTAVDSPPATYTASPISLQIKGANGVDPNHIAYFDQFILSPVASVPLELSVFPDSRVYLSGTEKIVATPTFGSETFTQVDFDVNDDGSVELSDTTAPFEFDWDTLNEVPAGTSRTLVAPSTPVKLSITVTDSESATKEIIEEYTIDNELDGRETLNVNGDFSQWQGTGFGDNLPVGWVLNWFDITEPQYGIAPGRNAAAGDALRITFSFPTNEPEPFPDRYALRTEGVMGNYRDMQTTYWGIGAYLGLFYMTSEDNITYASTLQNAGQAFGSSGWTLVVQTPVNNALGLTDTTYTALGTHQLGVTDHFWDDVNWEGNLLPVSADVQGWNLY